MLFARCHWCLLPCSLVWGTGFCGPSALFGSPIPFATWSPLEMSQGLMFPLYRSVLWFQSCIGLPLGRLSVPFSYDSFESAVPLATWSPFGMSQGFAGSSASLASLGYHSVVVSLRGLVSVFFYPLPSRRFAFLGYLWLSFDSFSHSIFHCPFWWGTPFRPRSLWMPLPSL